MAKDITIAKYQPADYNGGYTTDVPTSVRIAITENLKIKEYIIASQLLQLVYDEQANYCELRTDSMVIYKYEPGDTLGGSPVTDAATMFASIYNVYVLN